MSFAITVTSSTESGAGGYTKTTTTTVVSPVAAAAAPAGPAAPAATAEQQAALDRGFPLAPNEVTTEFLTACFGAEVATFDIDSSMLATGVLADAFRVGFTYADAAAAAAEGKPTSAFFKCTKHIEAVAALSVGTHVYEKEVYFYRTLIHKVKEAIRTPECFGVFVAEGDDDCKEFLLVMEEFDHDSWHVFDQQKDPMSAEDFTRYLKNLAKLHGACWGIPVDATQAGLGDFTSHWQPLNVNFTGGWAALIGGGYADCYGHNLTDRDPEVAKTILRVGEICSDPKVDAAIVKRLQSRPRTLTHGDARGANIFRSNSDKSLYAFIDWQMWAAGPAANEFPQVWLNSFALESGITHRFDEYMDGYYAALCAEQPKAAEYSLEDLKEDVKLQFINMWMQYVVFTVGSLEGYKDPANKASADNWDFLMMRNMETIHHTNVLPLLERFAASLP